MGESPATTLLAHDAWANRAMHGALASLTPEQLDRPFEMGLGALRPTFTHILGATRGWTDVLAGRSQRPRLEADEPMGPPEWQALLEPTASELREAALSGPMDEVLHAERNGKTYTFVRAHVVTHVTTHAVHHRAQCLNMLRHLGVDPLPPSSVLEWMFAGSPGA